MDIIPLTPDLADEWDALVESSPDGWGWALSGWQRSILAVREWQLQDHSFAFREGKRLVGVMPLQYSPLPRVMSSSGWGGTGPVAAGGLAPRQRAKVLRSMLDHARDEALRAGALELAFSCPPVTNSSLAAVWGMNSFVQFGYEDRSGISQVIDLRKDEEALWRGLSETARQSVRRARERGYEVEQADWPDMVDEYYALHVETYTRTGVPPHPKAYFAGLARELGPSGHQILWACRDAKGQVAAFHNSSRFKEGGYYHTGCGGDAALADGVNYLLFWEVMRGMKALGTHWYDCGEIFPGKATGKEHGLTVFKTKFGGEPHRYFKCRMALGEDTAEAGPSGRRAVVRAWLKASKQVAAAVAGERAAQGAVDAARAVLRTARGVLAFARFCRRVPFIKPCWGGRELRAGLLAPDYSLSGADERASASLRAGLGVPAGWSVALTSSGRTALELALRVLSSGNPDRRKVIVPSYSCKGVLDPVLNCGLSPVYVDMDEELLADPDAIRACLGSDVLACIFAHLGGRIADVAGLRAEAARHGVAWIDDHCQSFTPELALDVNSMTVFSFGLGKNLMATAGGALVSPLLAEDCARAAAAMDREPSRHARVRFAVSLLRFYAWRLWPALAARLVRLGSMTSQYGYRLMSRRDAALLGAQLDSAGSILAGRRRNARVMLDALQSDAVLTQAGAGHVYTKLSFIFGTPEARERFFEVMGRQGIEYEPMYVPLHMRMGEACVSTRIAPLCERMYRNVFNVPVRPNLTPRELRRVKNAIGKL